MDDIYDNYNEIYLKFKTALEEEILSKMIKIYKDIQTDFNMFTSSNNNTHERNKKYLEIETKAMSDINGLDDEFRTKLDNFERENNPFYKLFEENKLT